MSATEPTDTGLIDIGGGGMFRSLRVRNFRIWFFGALASSMGAWMQATAMGWVVLTELTAGDAAANTSRTPPTGAAPSTSRSCAPRRPRVSGERAVHAVGDRGPFPGRAPAL